MYILEDYKQQFQLFLEWLWQWEDSFLLKNFIIVFITFSRKFLIHS